MKTLQKVFIGLIGVSIVALILCGVILGTAYCDAHPWQTVFPEVIGAFVGLFGAIITGIISNAQSKKAKKELDKLSGNTIEKKPKTKADKIGTLFGVIIGIPFGLSFVLLFLLVMNAIIGDTVFDFLKPYMTLAIVIFVICLVAMIVFGILGTQQAKRAKEKAAQDAITQAHEDFAKVKEKASSFGLPNPPSFIRIPNSPRVVWFKDKVFGSYFDYTSDTVEDVNYCLSNNPLLIEYKDIVCYQSAGSVTTEQQFDPGKSDSALGGVGNIIGSVVGGNAGFLLKAADSVQTGTGPSLKTITHDTRHVLLTYRSNAGLQKIAFPADSEEIFDRLIPEKSFIFLQSKSIENASMGLGGNFGASAVGLAAALPVMQEILSEDPKKPSSEPKYDDIEAKLEKLNNLLEKKLITQADYDKKRQELLSNL